jgi:hypothetical protein
VNDEHKDATDGDSSGPFQCSSVVITTKVIGSIPSKGKRPDQLWGQPNLQYAGHQGLFRMGNAAGA